MSLKHAILGFLSNKPLSGYDLKKAFDRSVQHFWPANQSQIYHTLAGMKDEGMVTQEIIKRNDRLDMKIYHITEAGSTELHRWLSTPLTPQDYREPFLIQVYFAGMLRDEEILHLLQHEIRAIEEKLAVYKSMYKLYQEQIKNHPNPRVFFLSITTLEYGFASNLVGLEWLKSLADRVKSRNYSLRAME